MTRRTPRLVIGPLLAVALLGACAMTRVKTAWTAPGVHTFHFRDEAIRRNGEHELCERIKSVPCAPAFAVVADEDRGNVEN